MKVGLKVPVKYIPVYLLVVSLFFNNFAIQYFALILFLVFFLFSSRSFIKLNSFFNISLLFVFIAVISYVYNLATDNIDAYAILFWLFSYFPPVLLLWMLPWAAIDIDFNKIYGFYKKIVYIQSFFLIFSSIKYGQLIVGDPATGTMGDANWVAFHISVVLLYQIVQLVSRMKERKIKIRENLKAIVEIIYFLIVFIIPESTATLGFFVIILGIMFLKEYIIAHTNIINISLFLVSATIGLFLFSKTYVYGRLQRAATDMLNTDIDKNPSLAKVNIYKKLLKGEIQQEAGWVLGSGPSTFTSRSSVMRMPEERVNDFPIELPYYKSALFAKYISPVYAGWRASRESYGNFASPQTTIISVIVELGLAGILCFFFLLYSIFRYAKNHLPVQGDYHKKFVYYFSVFYLLNLFHLNFWEYPIITFTYLIFVFLIFGIKEQGEQFTGSKIKNT